jgi:nucleoside-diphosphate-sugar epimerase
MEKKRLTALICRAPEFYGPGKTQSITNSSIVEPLAQGKAARVFLRDDTLRSLIYTPDASRAMALLGNTGDAYGQTWHLPCDDDRLTYRAFIALAAEQFGTRARIPGAQALAVATGGPVQQAHPRCRGTAAAL